MVTWQHLCHTSTVKKLMAALASVYRGLALTAELPVAPSGGQNLQRICKQNPGVLVSKIGKSDLVAIKDHLSPN